MCNRKLQYHSSGWSPNTRDICKGLGTACIVLINKQTKPEVRVWFVFHNILYCGSELITVSICTKGSEPVMKHVPVMKHRAINNI